MTIWDLLPQDPMLGPPLPRLLGIFWPWAIRVMGNESATPVVPSPPNYSEPFKWTPATPSFIKSVSEGTILPIAPVPTTTYSNREEWEIEWTDDGLPKRVIVHRKAEEAK